MSKEMSCNGMELKGKEAKCGGMALLGRESIRHLH